MSACVQMGLVWAWQSSAEVQRDAETVADKGGHPPGLQGLPEIKDTHRS